MPKRSLKTAQANEILPRGYVAEWKGQGLHICTSAPDGHPKEYVGQFRSVDALQAFLAAAKATAEQ